MKEPKEAGLKKKAAGVNKFLEELVKIGSNLEDQLFSWSSFADEVFCRVPGGQGGQ